MSPIFQKKSILAIDIHVTDIRIAQIANDHSIVHMQSFPLPSGVFEKDRLVQPEKVSQVITEALKQFPHAPDEATIIVPDIHCFTQVFTIPGKLEEEQKKIAIVDQATRTIPVDQNQVYWDYFQQGEDETQNSETVVYIAVLREIINQYVTIAEQAKLSLISVEPEVLILSKTFLIKDPKNPPGANMILTAGDTTVSITAFDQNNKLLFSTIVPFLSGYFTRSIVQSFVAQAETEKKIPELNPETVGTNRETVLQTALQTVSGEIKKAQNYLTETFHIPTAKVVIAGELAMLPNSEAYFTSTAGVPVTIGTVQGMQSLGNIAQFGKPEVYVNLIGLSLNIDKIREQTNTINLLPQKEKKPAESKSAPVSEKVVTTPAIKKPSSVKKWLAYLFIFITFAVLVGVAYFYIFLPIRQHQ